MILFICLWCIQHLIPCTHCNPSSLFNIICIFHTYIIELLQYVWILSLRLHHIWKLTQYIQSENIAVEFCSTNHRLHRYLVITSLFYVWNRSTMGLQIEKANYLTNVHLLSWGGHDFFSSPLFLSCALPLSSTAGRQKEVRATEVLFWLFIHGFSI